MNIIVAKGFSTDVHLFKTGQPPATGSTPVGTSAYVLLALDGTTTPATRLSQLKITYDTLDAERDTSQPYVAVTIVVDPLDKTFLRLSFEVLPSALLGETYCRVAYGNEGDAGYSNMIFRVTVHQSLNRFWIGNKRITLFNSQGANAFRDERSLVVYAECAEASIVTSLVNLSGNSYLSYTSSPGITCEAGIVRAQFDPATVNLVPQQLGTVEVMVGTKPAELLAGSSSTLLPVFVKAGTDVPRPVLRRFDHNHNVVADPKQVLKLLVLTEGFNIQTEVDAWLDFFKDQLINAAHHTPFNKLADNIEMWTADMLSEDTEPGINVVSPLTQDGYLVPTHPIKSQTLPGATPQKIDTAAITIRQLLTGVGLPTANEDPLVFNAKQNWATKYTPNGSTNTDTHTFKSLIPQVSQTLYDAWRHQMPKIFLYAKDTIFNIATGTKQLREGSPTRLTRGDWAIGEGRPKFAGFRDEAQKERYRAILKGLTSANQVAKGTDWDPESTNALAAGIVLFLVHDPLYGGSTVYYIDKTLACFTATGQQKVYDPIPSSIPLTNTNFKDTPPQLGGFAAVNSTPLLTMAVFVHELGHMLGLGDEYGNIYGNHETSLMLTKAVRWSREGGQKKDVYFFCYGSKNQRGVARQTT